jgi:fumarate reductase subunit C
MIYFLIMALLAVSMILLFAKSCRAVESFRWSKLTFKQRFFLASASALLIQFFILTMLPGFLIAMYAVGYNERRTTTLETVIFPVVMLLSNILIYYFIFYILIGFLMRLLAEWTAEPLSIVKD